MSYILQNPGHVFSLTLQHLGITLAAMVIALMIALPMGLFIYTNRRLTPVVLSFFGMIYTIPSLALIILLLPVFGLNARAVIAALVLYAQIILLRNMLAGLEGVNPAVLEAATGMGMSAWQRWQKVHLPLALPVILAGLRITSVTMIAIAAIGAKFGAGGLGTLLFEGIAQSGRYDKIWAGTISLALLAAVLNTFFLWLERKFNRRAGHLQSTKSSLPQARTIA